MQIVFKNILIICAATLLCTTSTLPNAAPSPAAPEIEQSLFDTAIDKTIALMAFIRDGIYSFSEEYIAPYVSPVVEEVAFNEHRAEIAKAMTLEDYMMHQERIEENIKRIARDAAKHYSIFVDPDFLKADIKLKSHPSGAKKTSIEYLQQFIRHHENEKENKLIIDAWKAHEKTYEELKNNQELQSYLNGKNQNPSPSSFKNICRGIGYTASCALGLYAGNAIYKNYLEQYFADNSAASRQNLLEKLLRLKEQCSDIEEKIETRRAAMEDASTDQQAKLKNIIEKLERSLAQIEEQIIVIEQQMEHPIKPSVLKKYSGVAVRIAVMAAATYLCYSTFRAVDERYFVPGPTTLSNSAWENEWQELNKIKDAFDALQEKNRIYKSWIEDIPRNDNLAEIILEIIQLQRDKRELEATHAMNINNIAMAPFEVLSQRLQ